MAIAVDLMVLSIVLLFVFLGYKRGLVKVAFKLCTFFIAIILAFMLYKPVAKIVIENTNIDETIESKITDKILPEGKTETDEVDLSESLPTIILKNSENTKVWANLKIGDVDLSSFDERTKTVKNIASIARKDDINGINIIADSIDKNVERFIVELAPKLKERGIKANLVINSNNGINTETYTGIVNYLITEVK